MGRHIILSTAVVYSLRGAEMLIDRVVRFLFPRQDHFFTLLEEIATRIDAAAVVFGELATATSRGQLDSIANRLKPIETEADNFCHRIFEELDRTFVTPIDREDIASLAKALDNIIDDMEHTAAIASLYRLEALTDRMRQLVQINVKAANELAKAVAKLRKFSDPDSIRGPTIAVHTLENEADMVYRGAVADLFSNGIAPMELIRQKDMLEGLERGVDRCEDAMDVIRSVIVKNG
jgi:predicted phosphate transport protein (TIGR00153 family)